MRTPYKLLLFLLLCCGYLGCIQAQTQTSYTFDKEEPGGEKYYIARDFITLKPGFHYLGTTDDYFYAKTDPYRIDESPLYEQKLDGTKSYVVGKIDGSASVAPSGAAIYEVPIKVSPGTGGMVPQLSIVYNSQGSDGLLGVGFSIDGLSSITRAPNNIRDGSIKAVNLDSNDKFLLDGNRLIAISGNYGENGTEYRTENNTFSKIISYTNTSTGPEYFVVYTKSGLIYEYGNTSYSKFKAQNSEHIITWLLNKVTDTKGNYYTISYKQDRTNGEYRPDRIDYTGNNTINPVLSPYNSIKFTYANRDQTNLTYIKGNKSKVSKLLTQIDIWQQTFHVKTYTIAYNTPTYGKYLLSQITEISENSQKVTPIKFEWYTNNDYEPKTREYDRSSMAQGFVRSDNNIYTGDFNGDGKTDFIATPKTGTYANKWGLFLANTDGTRCSYTASGDLLNGFQKIYTGDFNGDGKTDIIERRQVSGSIYTNYFVYYSTGSSFSYGGPAFLTVNDRSSELIVGDFNGDGISDALVYYPGAKDYDTFTSSYSNGTITSLQKKSVRYLSINWDRVEVGDFNGDGLTDFLNLNDDKYVLLKSDGSGTVSSETSGTWPNKKNVINLGDFNGDGKTDMLVTGWNNTTWSIWTVALSTGTGFDNIDIPTEFDTNSKKIYVGDLNGDGKDDFCAVDKTSSSESNATSNHMLLYVSNGTGSSFACQTGISVYPTDKIDFYSGDFNGDGRLDFLNKSNFSGGFSGYQLLNSITDRDRLLKSATDSYGNVTSFTYKPLTNDTVYTAYTDGSYPVSDMTSALPVVYQMTQPDGIGGTKTITYKYEGAKIHKQGKGFLGFSKFTAKDEQTGISSISFYEHEPSHYAVGLKKTETRLTKNSYDNILLSEANYTNTYKEYNGNSNTPIYTYLQDSVVKKDYELGATVPYKTDTTSYTYDDYGNVLTTKQSFGNEASIRSVNEYTNNTTNWYLGRLTKTTVTKHAKGQSVIVRVSQFEYDPISGMLTKEIVEPGNDSLGLYKKYRHDAFGNIVNTTIVGNGNSRSDSSEYDIKGRLAIRIYNSLGHKTLLDYDGRYGTVKIQTDANSLKTITSYDTFGKPYKITEADGSKTIIAYGWCNGMDGAPSGSLWLKYTETSGSSPAKVYYDKLGREMRKEVIGFDGRPIYSDIVYNALGQVAKQSNPYFKGETAVWTEFSYDEIGRLIQKTLPDGNTIKITYQGLTTITENPLRQKDTKYVNQQGQLVESKNHAGKSVTYVYNSAGNLIETHDSKGNVIRMKYDLLGNRIKLIDPDLGTITSVYNSFGELISETDAKGNKMSILYDNLGRMIQRTEPEGVTTWTYDTGTCGIGRLASVNGYGGYKQEIEYDSLGRTANVKETINGITYTTSTEYDSYSRVLKTKYPSVRKNGPVVRNKYNTYGYLASVSENQTGKVYWKAASKNANGQLLESSYGNGTISTRIYDPLTGEMTHQSVISGSTIVQEWGYEFDAVGNLIKRTDYKRNKTVSESFEYDNLNRLIEVQNNAGTLTMAYNELGNIVSKSDVGTYHYDDTSKPNRLTNITKCEGCLLKDNNQNITYTSFDKVKTITQDSDELRLFYDADYQRIYADSYKKNVLAKRRTYINNLFEYEKDYATGNVRETFYIFGGDGLVAIRVRDNSADKFSYVHKDHLGSVQCLTNESGSLEQEMSYDAWGNRRDPNTLQVYTSLQTGLLTDRGFTGHEHIDLFALVNMDGRMYDPIIGRFLSPDPLIQMPENLQSLNRYAYCLNNPLTLTDPSGYSWLSRNWKSLVTAAVAISVSALTAGIGSTVGVAILAGAAGGFAGGVTGTLLAGGNIGQALIAGVIGGAIGAASGFLNYAAGCTSVNGSLGQMLEKAAKHAFVDMWMGGARAAVYGGEISPVSDMISGALSSVGNGYINDDVDNNMLKIASSAVLGGTISEIGGGKFANGAVTGAYSMLFNDIMHNRMLKKYVKQHFKTRLPNNVKITWIASNISGGLTKTENARDKNGNLKVFVSSSYLTDPDNAGFLYDTVDHELVHVGDYSSGRALLYFQNYKKNGLFTIMEYKAYSENLWYNTHVDINRPYHNQYVHYYQKQVKTYKAGLPQGWGSIK
jgi:RHS repeat-associated protein